MTHNNRAQRPIPSPWLAQNTNCSECDKKRSTGDHTECSKAKQKRFEKENEALKNG